MHFQVPASINPHSRRAMDIGMCREVWWFFKSWGSFLRTGQDDACNRNAEANLTGLPKL